MMRIVIVLAFVSMLFSCAREDMSLYADQAGYERSRNPEVTFVIKTESEFHWVLKKDGELTEYGHAGELTFNGHSGEVYSLEVEMTEPSLIRIEYYVNGQLSSVKANSCEMLDYGMTVQL